MDFKLVLNPGADFNTSRYESEHYGVYIRFPEVYDEESDNVKSILHDVQEAIEEAHSYEFHVSAFDEDWNHRDSRTDFFLQQLPDVIEAVKAFRPFSINFYEQEPRIVRFKPYGDIYHARLTKLQGGQITPVIEKIDPAYLLHQFRSLRDDYMNYLAKVAPRIGNHPWLANFFHEKPQPAPLDFRLILRPGADFSTTPEDETGHVRFPNFYDPELHNVVSLLIDVCDALEESTATEFIVSGFNLRWQVEVGIDLCIFLEHLPYAIASVNKGADFSIHFYEQHIQRLIEFTAEDGIYSARCKDLTKDVASPVVETIKSSELLKMFCGIRDDFVNYVEQGAPRIAAHPWFTEFFNGTALV